MKRDGISVLLPTVIVSLSLLGVGVSGAWYSYSMERRVTQAVSADLSVTLATEHFVQQLYNFHRSLNTLAEVRSETCVQSSNASFAEIERSFGDLIAKVDDSPLSVDQYCDNIQRGLANIESRLSPFSGQELSAIEVGEFRDLIELLNTQILDPALELLAEVEAGTTRVAERNNVITERVGLGMLLLGITGGVAGLVFGYGVARYVSQSVIQMSLKIQDITGKYDEAIGTIEISDVESLETVNEALGELARRTAEIVKQLSHSELQAERAEQLSALGKLAAGLAHEIRNPLASMKLLVQSAQEKPMTPRDLGVFEQEILRLEKMLKTFVDFARPPLPDKSLVDLRLAIDQTVSVVRLRAKQQQVTVNWLRPTESFDAVMDANQVQQSLLNLLLNSLDALPAGGNINVSIRKREIDDFAILTVADDGPGIQDDTLPKIFEPFYSTKDKGLGLGLPICKKVVEQHDGTIEVRSGAEGGTEFTIYLPLNKSA
jgi:signal transduction histidine kinase